ncbi:DUF6708 domain-containing protein, partial [Arhodomonas sp. KWT]
MLNESGLYERDRDRGNDWFGHPLKLDRSLRRALPHGERATDEVYDAGSIYKKNGIYLETTHAKERFLRGMLTGGTVLPLIGIDILVAYFLFSSISDLIADPNDLSLILLTIYTAILWGGVNLFALYSPLMYDWFNYRHAPIRFNRRTRQVHVFYTPRFGGPRSYDWDALTAQILETGRGKVTYYVLTMTAADPSGRYYYDRFEVGNQLLHREEGIRWWEYIRRFMEEGPDSVPDPDWTLSEHLSLRESFVRWFALHELRRERALGLNVRPAIARIILISPFLALFSIG